MTLPQAAQLGWEQAQQAAAEDTAVVLDSLGERLGSAEQLADRNTELATEELSALHARLEEVDGALHAELRVLQDEVQSTLTSFREYMEREAESLQDEAQARMGLARQVSFKKHLERGRFGSYLQANGRGGALASSDRVV